MTNKQNKYESLVSIQDNDDPIIFLFHGTGADYTDLIPIAKLLNPQASFVSVNGNVFVGGARRYFDRTAAGVDTEDLAVRAQELASYLETLIKEHDLSERQKIAIGYSNGANIIIGMLQKSQRIFDGVGLLHGAPYLEEQLLDVKGLEVFVSLGENDNMIDPKKTLELIKAFDGQEALVTVYTHLSGHRLTTEEVDALHNWYISLVKRH